MKLRIKDNSIRLRLSQQEVTRLHEVGTVTSVAEFPSSRQLSYGLMSSPALVRPSAVFDGDSITVRLPQSTVEEWATSEEVSIRAEQELDAGSPLLILVEKDFQCLVPRDGEDEAGLFPHPHGASE